MSLALGLVPMLGQCASNLTIGLTAANGPRYGPLMGDFLGMWESLRGGVELQDDPTFVWSVASPKKSHFC